MLLFSTFISLSQIHCLYGNVFITFALLSNNKIYLINLITLKLPGYILREANRKMITRYNVETIIIIMFLMTFAINIFLTL